jgi:antitoxin component YwqK of YwqJK toxin-antitoxin module
MKNHYQTLGLNEGASQKEIQTAYERLSKELDPKNNDNQEFFIEEYKKIQEAYKALSNPSILATEKGAKQVFEKPTPSPKIKSVSTKKPVTKTSKKAALKKRIIFSIAVFSLAIIAYKIYYSPKTYERSEIVFNKDLVYVKKDMTLLNGKINDDRHKGEFVNGMKEGFHSIQYLYTGKDTLFSNAEGEFKNNKYTSEWLFYHPSGQLIGKGVYRESEGTEKGRSGIPIKGREGLWRFWHENGQLSLERGYVNGKEEGLRRAWHENGQLSLEGSCVNGEAEGFWRSWHENGQLSLERGYVNGKEEGLRRAWHENGQLSLEGSCVNGEAEGFWRSWHKNGQLKAEGEVVNNKYNGLWSFYYFDGKKLVQSTTEYFYEELYNSRDYTKSFYEFKIQFGSEEAQKKLYDQMIEDDYTMTKYGDYTKSFYEFKIQYFKGASGFFDMKMGNYNQENSYGVIKQETMKRAVHPFQAGWSL